MVMKFEYSTVFNPGCNETLMQAWAKKLYVLVFFNGFLEFSSNFENLEPPTPLDDFCKQGG